MALEGLVLAALFHMGAAEAAHVTMSKEAKQIDPIPVEFASYEEAAEFWDTHDTTDYPDSFETVAVEVDLKRTRAKRGKGAG